MKDTYACDYCGKEFQRYASNVRGKHTFCSEECSYKFARPNRKEKMICDHCGKEFERLPSQTNGKNKYCSRACHHDAERTSMITTNCDHCGREITRKGFVLRSRKHHFCNRDCLREYFIAHPPAGESRAKIPGKRIVNGQAISACYLKRQKRWFGACIGKARISA